MAPALGAGARVGGLVGGLPLRVLLALHPPVLEPDLDLPLREAQHARHLNSSERKMLTEMLPQLSSALHYLGIIF